MHSSSARSRFTTSSWSDTHECCFQQAIVPKMMKNRFGKSKHKKFQDDWAKAKEPVVEGITFYVKYLGMALVDKSNDENCTAEAVKKIVNQVKYGTKPNKVSLKVTPQGILQTDVETEQITLEVSIYRISYCTADKTNEKVFGFIYQNHNDLLELHAYLCTKRKVAEAIALTVAHSFNIALERWEEKQDTNNETNRELASGEMLELQEQVSSLSVSSPLNIPGEGSSSENGVSDIESFLGASPPLPSTNVVIDPPPRNPRVPSTSRICTSAPSSLPPPPPPPRPNQSRAAHLGRDNSSSTIVTKAETHVNPPNKLHDWTGRESYQTADSAM